LIPLSKNKRKLSQSLIEFPEKSKENSPDYHKNPKKRKIETTPTDLTEDSTNRITPSTVTEPSLDDNNVVGMSEIDRTPIPTASEFIPLDLILPATPVSIPTASLPTPSPVLPKFTLAISPSPPFKWVAPSPAQPSTRRPRPTLAPSPSPWHARPVRRPVRDTRHVRVSFLDLGFSPFQYSRKREKVALREEEEEVLGNYFSQVPYEIILEILSFLKTSRDLCSVACVTKRWRILSADDSLWKPLFQLHFGSISFDSSHSWKWNFLKRKQELFMEKILNNGVSYGKKKVRKPVNNFMGIQKSNSLAVFKKVVKNEENGKKKRKRRKRKIGRRCRLIGIFATKKEIF